MIRVREPITEPDAVIVQDPTLLHQVDLFAGLADDGYLLVNTGRTFPELGLGEYVGRFAPGRCTPSRRPTSHERDSGVRSRTPRFSARSRR